MSRSLFPGSFREAVGVVWALFAFATAACGPPSPIARPPEDTGIPVEVDVDASIDHQDDASDDAPVQPPLTNGAACTPSDVCASGFCVDGVCCDSECAQTCFSCNLAGSAGSCVPVEVGTDPRDSCPDDGSPSCGRDGQCDGSGACRRYPVGVICRAQGCTGSTRTNAFRCDSTNVCRPSSGQPCDPYVCDGSGNDCLTVCTTNADCLGGTFCANGSCGKKPLGAACGLDEDCNSTICQQGVCCGTLCDGTCRSCAVPGAAGTCTEVPAGEDPLNHCTDSGRTTCGSDGACDGQGACRRYSAGTVCHDPACNGPLGTAQGRCDGLGTCALGPPVTCGTCQACTLTPTAAVCTPVAAGAAPAVAGQCANQGAPSCGTDGTCDGAGACRLYLTGTVCVGGACPTGATQLAPRVCNGAGTCQAAATAVCPGQFLCNVATNVCKTTCTIATSAADCAAPSVCTGNSCGTLKLQYSTGGVATDTTLSPHPQFRIINLGAAAIALADLTIRYWYTADGAQGQSAAIDFAVSSSNIQIQGNVTSLFTPVTRTGADFFMQLGFTAAAGNIAGNGGQAIIQSRFNSLNFALTYTQPGDYSFDASKGAFADWTHVTLYQRGVLVWGIEPAAL